jgi:hypothetical protein
MSTPSGKPLDQTSPPAFSLRRINEQSNAGPQLTAGPQTAASNSVDTSPAAYAPKRLRVVQPAATPEGGGEAAPLFLMRDGRQREEPAEPRTGIDPGDAAMRAHGPAGDPPARRRHPVDLDSPEQPAEPVRRPGNAQEAGRGGKRAEPAAGFSAERPTAPQNNQNNQNAQSNQNTERNESQSEKDDFERLEAGYRPSRPGAPQAAADRRAALRGNALSSPFRRDDGTELPGTKVT